jgi:hypothetical protein
MYMQSDLELLKKWFNVNSLTMNINKTKYMIVTRGEQKLTVTKPKLNDICLEQVFTYNYLGLIIDAKLKFGEHIEYVKTKIAPIIGILWRTRHIMPNKLKRQVYYAFINSHLSYLVGIWGNAYEKELDTIKVLQNKAVKIIFNYDRLKNTKELYQETKLLNVKSLNCKALCTLMYKYTNNLIKNNFEVQYNNDVHRYNTRQAIDLHIDFSRTNIGKMGILTKAVNLYNDLPREIKEAQNIKQFTMLVKEYWLMTQGSG